MGRDSYADYALAARADMIYMICLIQATAGTRQHRVFFAEVLREAHLLRVKRGKYNIKEEHLADALERLTRRTTRTLG